MFLKEAITFIILYIIYLSSGKGYAICKLYVLFEFMITGVFEYIPFYLLDDYDFYI